MTSLRRDHATGELHLVLPAQHPATLARRGKQPDDALRARAHRVVQQVYAPGFTEVLDFPADAVTHLPPASLNVTRLVLCASYYSKQQQQQQQQTMPPRCKMGRKCKFVHADSATILKRHEVHINYAWRSAADVEYACFPPGQLLRVALPGQDQPAAADGEGEPFCDVMESHLALKTQALVATAAASAAGQQQQPQPRPLSHCAHYYYNRACNLGADCQFIHAVFIDPDAKPHQRAPMPVHLGRSSHSNNHNNNHNAFSSAAVAPCCGHGKATATSMAASAGGLSAIASFGNASIITSANSSCTSPGSAAARSISGSESDFHAPATAPVVHFMCSSLGRSLTDSDAATSDGAATPKQQRPHQHELPLRPTAGARRFRYDPYSANGCVTWLAATA